MDYEEFKKQRGMIDRAEGNEPAEKEQGQPRRGRPPKEPEPAEAKKED